MLGVAVFSVSMSGNWLLLNAQMEIYGSTIGVANYRLWHPYGGTINFKTCIETELWHLQTPVPTTSDQCLATVDSHNGMPWTEEQQLNLCPHKTFVLTRPIKMRLRRRRERKALPLRTWNPIGFWLTHTPTSNAELFSNFSLVSSVYRTWEW